MEVDILKNNFETIYKEYKDYESYLDSKKEEIETQKKSFEQRVLSGKEDDDTLVEALFDLSVKPIQCETDLRILRDRLTTVYDAYKLVVEFPSEIKEEMSSLMRPHQSYRIFNGEHVEVDKEKNDRFKEEARKNHSALIKSIKLK